MRKAPEMEGENCFENSAVAANLQTFSYRWRLQIGNIGDNNTPTPTLSTLRINS